MYSPVSDLPPNVRLYSSTYTKSQRSEHEHDTECLTPTFVVADLHLRPNVKFLAEFLRRSLFFAPLRLSYITLTRSPFIVPRSPFPVHRSPFIVLRSPFSVPRSSFPVPRHSCISFLTRIVSVNNLFVGTSTSSVPVSNVTDVLSISTILPDTSAR